MMTHPDHGVLWQAGMRDVIRVWIGGHAVLRPVLCVTHTQAEAMHTLGKHVYWHSSYVGHAYACDPVELRYEPLFLVLADPE